MHPMLAEGLNLMLVGMSVVFAFLALLVVLVGWMSALVHRLAPEDAAPPAPNRSEVSPAPAHAVVDPRVLQVIQDAVRQHRAARES